MKKCLDCKNYKPKEVFKTGDIFINKYNFTLILTYVSKGSFCPLYSEAGAQHSFFMGGYCFANGNFRIGGNMYYTIEELLKHHKGDELRKVGHVDDIYAFAYERDGENQEEI